ncbi:ankyrin repeat domain-containing protein [Actinomadura sp. WMMB 499]|uniref:ankyrin repeat domain-containing protein n=1 Tax=Actinomadura sp. WMMB 499 TaxID=1219491 RepID=UPI0020C79A51|nr:ankyrin repeat domain-containing protein [Actinomadura sp. WMMB 499]
MDKVRAELDAGADPLGDLGYYGKALHVAAERGSPEVVAELARRAADVDAEVHGRTALWVAVCHRRPDMARVLVEAGADPWRPMMGGWSPGRLSLAGPTPDLFDVPADEPGLTEDEAVLVSIAPRLNELFAPGADEGAGLACVTGIDADEAVRRLDGVLLDARQVDTAEDDMDDDMDIVGVTDVPGGCVVVQPWGYAPQMTGVVGRLSAGTVAYGMYANPKSGGQGILAEEGVIVGSDLSPGGPDFGVTSRDVLAAYLTPDRPVAHCFVHTGLTPADARAIEGPPDVWIRLPARDWWEWSAWGDGRRWPA